MPWVPTMNVRELMTSQVWTCAPSDSLNDAARLMWDHDCGVLPVVDRNGCVGGIITDRDICMGAYTQGADLASLRVADSMSASPVTCAVGDSVQQAARRMAEHRLRRLPVVDEEGKVVGILTINDLATRAAGSKAGKGLERDVLAVLQAVSKPRGDLDLVAVPEKDRGRAGGAEAGA